MNRTRRIAVLSFLAVSILAIRAMDLYRVYYCRNIDLRVLVNAVGLNLDVSDRPMLIRSVARNDPMGRATPAFQAGFQGGDRMVSLTNARGESRSILSLSDFGALWRTIRYDEPWSAEVLRASGPDGLQRVRIQVPRLPHSDARLRLLTFMLSVMLPLVTVGAALFIGFARPDNNNAFLACLLFLGFSCLFQVNSHTFPPSFRAFALIVSTTFSSFAVYLFLRFFLLFPSPSLVEQRLPQMKNVFLALTSIVWAVSITLTFARYSSIALHEQLKSAFWGYDRTSGVLSLIMFGLGLVSLVLNTLKTENKDERRRMAVLAAGAVVGLLPLAIYVTYRSWTTSAPPWWSLALVAMTLAIFPFVFVHVILKHRVMGIRVILRRGLQYALVSRGFRVAEGMLIFVFIYFAAGSFFANLFPNAGTSAIAISTAIVTFGLLAALQKVDQRVMLAIDQHFFRDALNSQRILTDLSHAIRRLAAQPEVLLRYATTQISDSLYPDRVAVFLREVKILHLTIDEDGMEKEILQLVPSTDHTYRCYSLAGRSRTVESASTEKYRLILKANSFISKHLENAVTGEPEAIDVYPDDPKSWASALAGVESQDDAYSADRSFIESLNLRLIVPLVSSRRIVGFIAMGEKLSEEPYSRENKELLLSVAEQMAVALDYALLIGQVAEQEKLKQEMQIAKEVQSRLFPQHLPAMKTLDYTGICKAARGVGGDSYDFLKLGDCRLGIALGDVSGKGISSALLMAGLQAMLRSHAPLRVDAVEELIQDINHLLVDSTETNKFATFFYGLYDEQRSTLTYVNAGHIPPLLLHPLHTDSGHEWETERLRTGGMVLGMFEDVVYHQETVRMGPGDILIVFSDGISEAMNAREEEFGEERLSSLIVRNAHLPATALRDLILDQVAAYAGETPQHDDQTLVIAKVL